jgi:hypothetical protein
MIATSHEEISGTSGMMDEPSVRDAHHGQVDPQIQEEVQDIHAIDPTHTGQSEEMESQLLETPVVEKMAEVDRWMEHLLPGSDCMDEDALFGSQDDDSTCLDTTIWDPGVDDSSRLSAQEDTTAHTGYSVSQGEMASSDGMQWHIGVPSGTVDNRQFIILSSAESVVSDGTSSERHEGVPQHDCDQESHHLAVQLGVSEAMIRVATRRIDDMHAVMADYGWRASVAQGSSDGGFSMDDFHTLWERVSVMRTDYQQLLTDRDYLLRVGEMYQSVTLTEDVDDLAEEHQSMGDTSICVLGVVDLHIEIDPAVRPGSVMQHEFAGDDMSMPEHTVMSDSSQRDV